MLFLLHKIQISLYCNRNGSFLLCPIQPNSRSVSSFWIVFYVFMMCVVAQNCSFWFLMILNLIGYYIKLGLDICISPINIHLFTVIVLSIMLYFHLIFLVLFLLKSLIKLFSHKKYSRVNFIGILLCLDFCSGWLAFR